ncbi:MAG: type II secretion system protein GspK, partial [Candidatus Omnitrophica bacterium]|nr:type II secretion system protein GspK [Candidatus Omnitrophota bacterium]
ELLLVKEMPQDIYIRIRDFITVQTDPTQIKVNINTASPEVMRSLLKYSVNQLNQNAATIDAGIAESLFTMINNFLRAGNNFSDAANLSIGLQQYINGPSYSQYENVLNQLGQYVRPASQYFRIISVGSVKTSVLSRKLECVYDKAAGKMVFWHQN